MQALKKELIGKSRGGNTTKIDALVDASGNPLKIVLTAGQVHVLTVAHNLIIDFNPKIVMADGGYDSLKFRKQIEKQGAIACIKPRNNLRVKLEFDKEQYKD